MTFIIFLGVMLLLVLLQSDKVEGMACFRMLRNPMLVGCSSIVDPQKLCSR